MATPGTIERVQAKAVKVALGRRGALHVTDPICCPSGGMSRRRGFQNPRARRAVSSPALGTTLFDRVFRVKLCLSSLIGLWRDCVRFSFGRAWFVFIVDDGILSLAPASGVLGW